MNAAQDVRFADAKALGEALVHQLDELREAAPVFWSTQQNAWIVTGHRETNDAFMRANIFSSGSRAQRV